jgi:uracil-DNA glycosylase family 4
VVIGDSPSADADATGVPFAGDQSLVWEILDRVGLVEGDPGAAEPEPDDVFLTYVTRCRHPDRAATDEEVTACEAYRSSELRMINPEIIVPVGQRALVELAEEYTTRRPESFDADAEHATTIRGRGFELVPMRDLGALTPAAVDEWVDHMLEAVLSRDYRQTKGRRER